MPLPKDPLKYENDMFKLLAAIATALSHTSAENPVALVLPFNTVQKARSVRMRVHAFMRSLERELASKQCRDEVRLYEDESRAASFALLRLEGSTLRILDRRYNTQSSSLGSVMSAVDDQLVAMGAAAPSQRPEVPAAMEYPSSIVADIDEES